MINYVFESHVSLRDFQDRLRFLDDDLHTYWLTCEPEQQSRRILERPGDDPEWELERFVELNNIQAAAAQRGFIGEEIDTTNLTTTEVAEVIWKQLFD